MVRWSNEEIDFVCDNYAHMKTKDIAKALGRSLGSVRAKASAYKIRRYSASEEQMYEEYLLNFEILNRIRVAVGLKPAKPMKNPY